jgi:hypothetical protein
MKPNKNQLIVINTIKSSIEDWNNTNDISSPSHWNLIDESINTLEDVVDVEIAEAINEKLGTLLTLIRKIK